VVTQEVVATPRGSSDSNGRAVSSSGRTTVRTVAGGAGTA